MARKLRHLELVVKLILFGHDLYAPLLKHVELLVVGRKLPHVLIRLDSLLLCFLVRLVRNALLNYRRRVAAAHVDCLRGVITLLIKWIALSASSS